MRSDTLRLPTSERRARTARYAREHCAGLFVIDVCNNRLIARQQRVLRSPLCHA
jgi:hypothetical protein